MEFDIKYQPSENLFRSYWINLLEQKFTDKELASHQIIDIDDTQVLYLDEFDIEIELIPNAKNRSMKLRVGDATFQALEEKYISDNKLEHISTDKECPFFTETTFTIRDLKKGTRFFALVKKFRGV